MPPRDNESLCHRRSFSHGEDVSTRSLSHGVRKCYAVLALLEAETQPGKQCRQEDGGLVIHAFEEKHSKQRAWWTANNTDLLLPLGSLLAVGTSAARRLYYQP